MFTLISTQLGTKSLGQKIRSPAERDRTNELSDKWIKGDGAKRVYILKGNLLYKET